MSSCRGFDEPDARVPEALPRHLPPDRIEAALAGTGGRRRRNRKVPAAAAVWLAVAIGLWGDHDVPSLWRHVVGTLASLWQAIAGLRPPCESAPSQASPAAAGPAAVRRDGPPAGDVGRDAGRGVRGGAAAGAVDGGDYTVPGTAANAAAFGRRTTARGGRSAPAGYPQVRVNRPVEVGTRLTLEALVKAVRDRPATRRPRPCWPGARPARAGPSCGAARRAASSGRRTACRRPTTPCGR